jgi:hypothetical protein
VRERSILSKVEHRSAVLSAALGAKRIEQEAAEGGIVKRVFVVALRAVLAKPIPLRPRSMEAVDGSPNHVTPATTKSQGKFRGKRCLARRVRPVDSHPQRMPTPKRLDQLGQTLYKRDPGRHRALRRHAAESTKCKPTGRPVAFCGNYDATAVAQRAFSEGFN